MAKVKSLRPNLTKKCQCDKSNFASQNAFRKAKFDLFGFVQGQMETCHTAQCTSYLQMKPNLAMV